MNPVAPSPRQTRLLWLALTGLALGTLVGLTAAAVWGLGRLLNLLAPVLWPLAVAAVLACLLAPVVDWLERRRLPRSRAILLVFAGALTLLLGLLFSVVPQIVLQTRELASRAPEYSDHLQASLSRFAADPPAFLHQILPWPDGESAQTALANNPDVAAATHWLTGSLPRIGSWILGQLLVVLSGFGLLAGLALVPVYTFYFLLEQRHITGQWTRYIPMPDPALHAEIVFILDAVRRYLVAYFRGQVLVALCDALLYTIGFACVGLNYSLLIGFAAVFLTMIPFLGALVVVITALALALAQYLDWQHPALVLAIFALVQTLEGVFISPKIIGDRVGLHPLVIIIAVMTGTTLFGGLLGGLLAIPLAAALRVILGRYLWQPQPNA